MTILHHPFAGARRPGPSVEYPVPHRRKLGDPVVYLYEAQDIRHTAGKVAG